MRDIVTYIPHALPTTHAAAFFAQSDFVIHNTDVRQASKATTYHDHRVPTPPETILTHIAWLFAMFSAVVDLLNKNK